MRFFFFLGKHLGLGFLTALPILLFSLPLSFLPHNQQTIWVFFCLYLTLTLNAWAFRFSYLQTMVLTDNQLLSNYLDTMASVYKPINNFIYFLNPSRNILELQILQRRYTAGYLSILADNLNHTGKSCLSAIAFGFTIFTAQQVIDLYKQAEQKKIALAQIESNEKIAAEQRESNEKIAAEQREVALAQIESNEKISAEQKEVAVANRDTAVANRDTAVANRDTARYNYKLGKQPKNSVTPQPQTLDDTHAKDLWKTLDEKLK